MDRAKCITQDRFRIVAVIGGAHGTLTHGVIEFADQPPVGRTADT